MRSTRDHLESIWNSIDPNIFRRDGGSESDFESVVASFLSCFRGFSMGFVSDIFGDTILLVLDNNDCLPS